MVDSRFEILVTVVLSLSVRGEIVVVGSERCPCAWNQVERDGMKFAKKVSRFWEFKEESNRWEEIGLPFELRSCVDGSCSAAGIAIERSESQPDRISIVPVTSKRDAVSNEDGEVAEGTAGDRFLRVRKRVSVTKISESSMWVTGPSGSIYERFWNGVRWVIVPHELPTPAGPAVSVFLVNQSVLALSEAGALYELQLNEESEQIWVEAKLIIKEEETARVDDHANQGASVQIKFLAVSKNGEKVYFSSKSGMLVEISELHPLRWTNYGRPPGADVHSIADVDCFRPGAVFTISSTGELFEFDKNSKPSWRKHIWNHTKPKEIQLATSKECCSFSLVGAYSQSLFLLSKDGCLLERQLQQRKWKWVVHKAPQGHHLSSITTVEQVEVNENFISIFFTTSTGSVLEYQLPKHSGFSQDNQVPEKWVDHVHPEHDAKVARGVSGIQLHFGRMIFPLDDGRLGELHLSSIGGEDVGPAHPISSSIRRRATSSYAYEWSILDAPETEGWNAGYCSDKMGPMNCITGVKVMIGDDELELDVPTRHNTQGGHQQHYLALTSSNRNQAPPDDRNNLSATNANFRMRVLHPEESFLHVSEKGLVFEYRHRWPSSAYGSGGIWLQHEYLKPIKGVVGNLNGSIYLVDKHGSLLIRERGANGLLWIDCTNMRNGKRVATGAPWDSMPGKNWRFAPSDAIYFINKKGKLLQFKVAFRMFEWRDCESPPNAKLAFIVDQENFRMNIVFVVGRNGRLYQYNSVTELWHEHYQSPHLVLSRLPGAVMRPSEMSSTGSLFMILENGGLVEYHWSSAQGWRWVEHGTPNWGVRLVAAPGPCFQDGQLFLIGSDGHVYRRYLDEGAWKWASNGHPTLRLQHDQDKETSGGSDMDGNGKICNHKVAAVRPIAFSENSVIFELQDGRLAELRRSEAGAEWEWTRVIGTPDSPCPTDYVMALAM